MTDDVLLNKAAIIERCLRRVKEEYASCPGLDDFTHQDAIVLNLERACQAAIDMAMHVIADRHLGVPQSSAQAFDLLERERLIHPPLTKALKAMVAFRNIAVHEYRELDLSVLRFIVEESHRDLIEYCGCLGITIRIDSPPPLLP